MRANPMRYLVFAALVLPSCKEKAQPPPPPPEVQLSTDLPEGMIETVLKLIERNGGPRAERIPGMQAGVSALLGAYGGLPADPAPLGDVRWDSEPYGAIAAAAYDKLMPGPISGKDVPPLWRDPGGTWVAVGGRALLLLVGIDDLGDHGAPVRFTALTEPWLKGKVAIAAPTGGPALAHFAALYQAWGVDRMQSWLKGLKQNDVQIYDDSEQVRLAVVSGRAVVGIVSSEEAAKAAASAAHVLVVYPNQRSIGVFVWPTALSVPKTARNMDAAMKLAELLADRSTEQLLVARVPGYLPLRPDIPVPPGVRSASNLVVVAVDPARIVEEIYRRRAELAAWVASMPKPPALTMPQAQKKP
jgi:iron(III) transport system substrate-binding protein